MKKAVLVLGLGAATAFSVDRLNMETDVAPATARFWSSKGPSAPETKVTFTIAMKVKPEAAATLERVFHEVSDPKHPMYGKHWTEKQVLDLIAPSDKTLSIHTLRFPRMPRLVADRGGQASKGVRPQPGARL